MVYYYVKTTMVFNRNFYDIYYIEVLFTNKKIRCFLLLPLHHSASPYISDQSAMLTFQYSYGIYVIKV